MIRPPGGRGRPKATLIGLAKGALFTAGGFAGAVVVMAAVWLPGVQLRPPSDTALVVIATLALAFAARDAGFLRLKLPQRHHQVKRETLENHPVYGVASFGFALGTAFWTFVSVSAPYILFAVVVLLPFPQLLIVAFAFAVGRGASVIIRMLVRVDEDRVVQVLMSSARAARTVSAIGLAMFAGALLRVSAGA